MMFRSSLGLVSIIGIFLNLTACSFLPEHQFLKDGISVQVQADKELNTFSKEPHTLVVILYQFSEQGTFKAMLEDPAGVATLLEGGNFDKTVLAKNQLVIQPGESKKVLIDRVTGVRYLGVVAGYYIQQPGSIGRLIPFERQSKYIYFWRFFQSDPSETRLILRLGKDAIIGGLS